MWMCISCLLCILSTAVRASLLVCQVWPPGTEIQGVYHTKAREAKERVGAETQFQMSSLSYGPQHSLGKWHIS